VDLEWTALVEGGLGCVFVVAPQANNIGCVGACLSQLLGDYYRAAGSRRNRPATQQLCIHAQVACGEGPQVPDPRAPEWAAAVEAHLQLWQHMVDRRQAAGASDVHTVPFTGTPVADAWKVNVSMREMHQQNLRG
jgi:hypothetical protein